MSDIKLKIENTIFRNNLIAKGDNILVGFSGGPDSVALLHILISLRDKFLFDLSACHLNHHIRGRESDLDEEFSKSLTRQLVVDFFCGDSDIPLIKKKSGGSTEEIARTERYRFYRRIAEKCGANKIALGHNSDDNVETFLFNLIRGTGLKGLAGIPICRPEKNLTVIRPLLDTSREDIIRYLKDNHLKWRVDSSNWNVSYTRNRIRLRLIPYLRKHFNPAVNTVINTTAKHLKNISGFLDEEIRTFSENYVKDEMRGFSINIAGLIEKHPAIQEAILKNLLVSQFGLSPNVKMLELLNRLYTSKGRYSTQIGGNVEATIEYDRLCFRKKRKEGISHKETLLTIPSEKFLDDWGICVSLQMTKKKNKDLLRETVKIQSMHDIWKEVTEFGNTVILSEYLDDSAVGDKIAIRNRKPGDRFKPIGGSSKKVKKLLINEKIPVSIRGRIPVFCGNEGKIFYIPGYRISDTVKVTEKTANVVKLSLTIFPL